MRRPAQSRVICPRLVAVVAIVAVVVANAVVTAFVLVGLNDQRRRLGLTARPRHRIVGGQGDLGEGGATRDPLWRLRRRRKLGRGG